MRKSVKVILIVASSLVGIGVLCLCMSIALGGFNLIFKPSGSLNYSVMTATFDEVEVLEIDDMSNDVRIIASENDEVKVTYSMSENFGYYLKQIDNTLIIEYDDFREWYEFIGIFSLRDYDLTVELPEKALDKLTVKTVSGDIEAKEIMAKETALSSTSGSIKAGGNVGELSVSSVSGDISLNTNTVAENAVLSTTGGDINLKGVSAKDTKISTTSGDIDAKALSLASAEVDTMSGEVEFNNVTCTYDMKIETTSGDMELEAVDADNYDLSSTSGEIDAKILTAKIYNVRTTSGSIDVPQTVMLDGGIFTAETTSGDIEVELVNQ